VSRLAVPDPMQPLESAAITMTPKGVNSSPTTKVDSLSESAEPNEDMGTFDQFGLSELMLDSLQRVNYRTPTPVQVACIPLVFAGLDVIVQAQTGTGKTAAFAIPIIEILQTPHAVECLVLAPTRELARQVTSEFDALSTNRKLGATAIYGGTSYGPQLKALQNAHIVVATPGRLLDHLRSGNIDLSTLKFFVLDEADEMLSMGFEKELNAILEFLPAEKQCLLFSATITEEIKALSSHFSSNPEYVSLSGDSIAAQSVEHFYFVTEGTNLLRDLVTLIEMYAPQSALIFCNTRSDTQLVYSHLHRRGYGVDVISGDLTQSDREKALSAVKTGKVRFLVATDVAARGIDISGLPFVINYMMAESAETYIHRTGRTGRAGQQGIALSLMLPQQIGTFYQLRKVHKVILKELSMPTREELHAMREARHLSGIVADLETFGACSAFSGIAASLLEREDAQAVVCKLIGFYTREKQAEEHRGKVPPPPPDRLSTPPAAVAMAAPVESIGERRVGAIESVDSREYEESDRYPDVDEYATSGNGHRDDHDDTDVQDDDLQDSDEPEGMDSRSEAEDWGSVRVNLGSKDLDIAALRDLVCNVVGLFEEDLGQIEFGDIKSTIAVRSDYLEDVTVALSGLTYQGRRIRASVEG